MSGSVTIQEMEAAARVCAADEKDIEMTKQAKNVEQFPTKETPIHSGLYAALAAAQAEMGRALKDSTNPHFKSSYADLASVMDACMPALTKNGIAVLQPPFDDAESRYVKTILVHGATGEQTECRVPLIIAKNDMQGYGSAVTYARRYGLMSMAGIAPDDDDGNAAVAAAPKPPSKNDETRKLYENFQKQMEECQSPADLRSFWSDADAKAIRAKLPDDWVKSLTDECSRLGKALTEQMAKSDDGKTPFEGE